MTRVAVALLLGGVALLLSWAIAPASPAISSDQTPSSASLAQGDAIVADVNAQVERMRARLTVSSTPPRPARDPFRFGRRSVPMSPASAAPAPPVVEAPPVLPRLLAILADSTGGAAGWRAVMALGDDVHILKAGDAVGNYVVRAVDEHGADLVDATALHVYRITLK